VTDTVQAPANDTAAPPPRSAPDVVHRHIPEPISTGRGDEENIRESVRVLNEKRERQWESGAGGDDPFAEQHAPVIERHYDRRDKSTKTLKQATTDLSNRHFEELPDVQQNAAWAGAEPAQLRQLGKDPDWVAQRRPDWTPAEVSEYVRTGAMPPDKIGVVDDRGRLAPALQDKSGSVLDVPRNQLFKNVREGTRAQANFRQADADFRAEQAQEQARLLAELQQGQQPDQPAQAQPVQEAAQPQPAQQPQPQPQPRQVDPVERQRRALQWEHQAVSDIRKLSVAEMHTITEWNRLQAQMQTIPEFANQALLNETYTKDPARYAQLTKVAQEVAAHGQALAQRLHQQQEVRVTRENQLAQAYETQRRQVRAEYAKKEDDAFHAALAREMPQFASKAARDELNKNARALMKRAGLDDQQIALHWTHGLPIDLRQHQVQMVLAKAAAWDAAQAKMGDIANKRASIPPVQRPGVARPRGAGADADIAGLERQVANLSGNAQLRAATRLTQARRAAGRL
jgi:hypothetical protein